MGKKRYTKNNKNNMKINTKNMLQNNSLEIVLGNNVNYESKFYNENLSSSNEKRVFIEYNPYTISTKITVEEKEPKDNSKLKDYSNKMLQEWIDKLPCILSEEYLSKNFKIGFHGILADYEDIIEISKKTSNNGINIELIHYPAKEVKDKDYIIQEIFDKIQSSPFSEFKNVNGSLCRAFDDYKKEEFSVNVLATMSAGKSTLINSLLSTKLMPSKNASCTAVITEIKDIKTKDYHSEYFTAKVYDKDENEIEYCDDLTLKKMEELNNNKDVFKIHVDGKIPFIVSDIISIG